MTPDDLRAFEDEVAAHFNAGEIRAPVHLSRGNEAQLCDIFRHVAPDDYVFSTWRSHYHCLLKGVPRADVMGEILDGCSMHLNFPEYRFFASSIVAGILPIAVGVAAGIKRSGENARVWAFIGDMTATTGIFHEARRLAEGHNLPVTFVVEDNKLSTDTPTSLAWMPKDRGKGRLSETVRYRYVRELPHVNTGQYVAFV
jgi:TPP-dependent pyruvate/acetoin dehydrogenase alpha subunit